jgi:hypothetical protein
MDPPEIKWLMSLVKPKFVPKSRIISKDEYRARRCVLMQNMKKVMNTLAESGIIARASESNSFNKLIKKNNYNAALIRLKQIYYYMYFIEKNVDRSIDYID